MKTADSVSDSNFKFEISQSLTLPRNATCYVDDITVPVSWYNVNENCFNLYMRLAGRSVNWIVIGLPFGQYNGATLSNFLNGYFNRQVPDKGMTSSYNISTSQLAIGTTAGDVAFQIFTDKEVATNVSGTWGGAAYNTFKPNTMNELIGNNNSNASVTYNNANGYTSPFLSFEGVRNLYLCSPNLCSLSVIGPRGGVCNIVKKIPVTSDFGYNIVTGGSIAHDYMECSRQTWKTLEFTLEDVYGNIVNLNNNPVSFSIILSTINEDM
jgi:hypothetical protein